MISSGICPDSRCEQGQTGLVHAQRHEARARHAARMRTGWRSGPQWAQPLQSGSRVQPPQGRRCAPARARRPGQGVQSGGKGASCERVQQRVRARAPNPPRCAGSSGACAGERPARAGIAGVGAKVERGSQHRTPETVRIAVQSGSEMCCPEDDVGQSQPTARELCWVVWCCTERRRSAAPVQ